MNNSDYIKDLSNLAEHLVPKEGKPHTDKYRKADEISQNLYEDNNRELRELYFLRKQIRQADLSSLPQSNERTLVTLNASYSSQAPTNPTKNETVQKENVNDPLPESTIIINKEATVETDKLNPAQECAIITSKDPTERLNESVEEDIDKGIFERWQDFSDAKPVKSTTEKPTSDSPILWINKLRYYPADCLLENMITFKQLMYEDLLKSSKFERLNNFKLLIENPNPARTLQTAFMTTFGYSMDLIEPILKGGVKVNRANILNF